MVIAGKAAALQEWFQKKNPFQYEEPTDEEIDTHLVDWSRVSDKGHLWKFPVASFCKDRLTEEEIAKHLPKAETLLGTNAGPRTMRKLISHHRRVSPLAERTPTRRNSVLDWRKSLTSTVT